MIFKRTFILMDNGVDCIATGIYIFVFGKSKFSVMLRLYFND